MVERYKNTFLKTLMSVFVSQEANRFSAISLNIRVQFLYINRVCYCSKILLVRIHTLSIFKTSYNIGARLICYDFFQLDIEFY